MKFYKVLENLYRLDTEGINKDIRINNGKYVEHPYKPDILTENELIEFYKFIKK